MCDLVPIHTGFDQVHQRARAKIEKDVLIRAHQISSRSPRGMHIGTRTENGQAHEWEMTKKPPSFDQQTFELQPSQD